MGREGERERERERESERESERELSKLHGVITDKYCTVLYTYM